MDSSSERRPGAQGARAGGAVRARLSREDVLARIGYALPVAFLLAFLVVPMSLTLLWSVFPRTMFWMEPGFTLEAYRNFFFSARFENFLMSAVSSAWAVLLSFALGFPIAVFLRRRVPARAQHPVLLLFILPFMISELIRTFSLRPVLGRTGLVNSLLIHLGLIDEPISAILYTPLGVVIGEVASFLPFMVFASFLAMEAVEKYIFEVCDDLGTGPLHTFKDVILPLAAPGVFAGSLFIFINGMGLAIIPDFLGGPASANAGIIVLNAIAALDFPLAMAISAVMVAAMVGLLYLGHRLFDLTRILEPIKR